MRCLSKNLAVALSALLIVSMFPFSASAVEEPVNAVPMDESEGTAETDRSVQSESSDLFSMPADVSNNSKAVSSSPDPGLGQSDDQDSTEARGAAAETKGGVQDDPRVLEEGDFGEGGTLHWSYKDDATLTISGSGSIPDYTEDGGQPWNGYLQKIEAVKIGEGITCIGDYAGYNLNFMQTLELPNGLDSIGDYAFYNAKIMVELVIPSSVTCIGDYAFYNAALIEELDIPDAVLSLGEHCFDGCSKLKTLHISESLVEIPDYCFYHCMSYDGFWSANLPANLERIGSYAFQGARFESLVLPDSLKNIAYYAFWSCRFNSPLTIPSGLEKAEQNSFLNIRVPDLILAEGLSDDVISEVLRNAYADRIHLPSTLKRLSNYGYAAEGWVFDEPNDYYMAFGGALYSVYGEDGRAYPQKNAVLKACSRNMPTVFRIPEGTMEICYESLKNGATDLRSGGFEKVVLPASMEVVNARAFNSYMIADLKEIDADKGNTSFSAMDGILFSKDKKELIRCPTGHRFDDVFIVPESVNSFGTYAFYECSGLKGLHIPSGVVTLGGSSFGRCHNLVTLQLPETLVSIKGSCFERYQPFGGNRTGFTVFFEGTKEQWDAVIVDGANNAAVVDAPKFFDASSHGVTKNGLLYYVTHQRVLNIVLDERLSSPPQVNEIADYGSGDSLVKTICDDFNSVVIVDGISRIGTNAFAGCEQIVRVTIPFGVEAVGSMAFSGCSNLKDIDCLGDAFTVEAVDSGIASFDAQVVIHCSSDAQGWKDPDVYDGSSRTWNGYALAEDLESSVPMLKSCEVFDKAGNPIEELTVKGVRQQNPFQELDIVVLSTDGENITSKVDIEVKVPEIASSITHQWENSHPEEYTLSYLPASQRLKVGHHAVAGTYELVIAPKQGVSSGVALHRSLTILHEQDTISEGIAHAGYTTVVFNAFSPLLGHYTWRDDGYATSKITVYNQYEEDVSEKCSITVYDGSTVITDDTHERSFYLTQPPHVCHVSEMALPRAYRLVVHGKEGSGITGSATRTMDLRRDTRLINVPYSLTLSGGETEISVTDDAREQWASVPYRVRVLDGYDDPCWPDLAWEIVDSNKNDCSDCFDVDEQGFLKIEPQVKDLFGDEESMEFTIRAHAAGIKGTNLNAIERFSNEQRFTLKKEVVSTPIVHIATFKVGEQEIGQVAFAEGDASLDEPAIPQKDNYVGTWEEYDLASAKSDIVVQGLYTPLDPDKISDIALEGDAAYEDGAVTINLAASASSKQVRVQSTQTRPLDVALVCDQSGSMDETLGSGEKKIDALKRCANQFVDALYENSVKTGADHRVALVGFSYSDYSGDKQRWNAGGYENTGLLITQSGGFKKFGDEARRSYDEAFLSIAGSGGVNKRIAAGIDSITAEGATAADLGLNLAKGIFAANSNMGVGGVTRERVVVFITDGVPTDWSNERERMKTTGANAIQVARDIKQGQGAHIYSIGVDAQASPSAAFWSSSDGVGHSGNVLSYDLNRFLHAVSSNYPEAAAMDALGGGTKDGGYYMAVNDTANLNKIFSSILYSTVYTVESFDRATLAYTLPANFILTMKQEEEMRAALSEQGMGDDDIIVSESGGTTTIVFKNVRVKTEYENGIPRYVARVKFRVSAKNGVSGSTSAGNASVDKSGDITECVLSDVVVPQDRCVLVFKVNDAIYEVRDAAMGDVIELPDTDIARWMELEKKVDPKVDSAYAIFETTTLDRKYGLRWIVGDNELTEAYAPGATIRVPTQVEQWIPEDFELGGWAPSLPSTMPGRSIICTAMLTPKHEHAYTASEYKTGDCTKGQVIHRACACGDEIEVGTAPVAAHDFDVILGCPDNSKALTVEELVCKICGHTIEKHVTYEVSRSQWGNSKLTVIDMSKYTGELQQNGISDDQIEMRFYIDTSFYDKNARYIVTRIDEDGTHYDYETRLQNGYLIFDPDHFSIYVIGALDEKTSEPIQAGMSYEEALLLLSNPDPDEAPIGGPGEMIGGGSVVTPPDSSDDRLSHGGSSDEGGLPAGESIPGTKNSTALVRTALMSQERVDTSSRSPKTGQILLRDSFAVALMRGSARAA